jgi:hypothetical protein
MFPTAATLAQVEVHDAYVHASPWAVLSLFGLLGAFGTLLWAGALIWCLWKDEERFLWLWILLFLNVVGALIYIGVRVLPRTGLLERFGARGRRNREIARVEADIVHLGEKPHLLHRLGQLLLDAGRLEEAERHLRASLGKEEDRDARFDLARVLLERGAREEAAALLAEVVAQDRNHAYGDALRSYVRALVELGRDAEARPLCEELVRTRPSAEARVRLAEILERAGDRAGAREQCERCEREAKATPAFAQGRGRAWVKRARKLRGRLG